MYLSEMPLKQKHYLKRKTYIKTRFAVVKNIVCKLNKVIECYYQRDKTINERLNYIINRKIRYQRL